MKNNQLENNQKLLNITYQTADMGVFAIDQIYNAIEDENLTILILKQKDKYAEIIGKCEKLADEFVVDIDKLNPMLKASSWASIKMKSMMNNETSHLCEMLIQGTTMGITSVLQEMGKLHDCDDKINAVASDLQRAMEEFIDSLKTMLTD